VGNGQRLNCRSDHVDSFLAYLWYGSCQVRVDPKSTCDFLKELYKSCCKLGKKKINIPFKEYFSLKHQVSTLGHNYRKKLINRFEELN